MTTDEALKYATSGEPLGTIEDTCDALGVLAAEVRRLRDRGYNNDIELAEKLRLTEADLAALRERHGTSPRDGDWWCPSCRDALPPERVTFEERCDTCGTPVTTSGAGLHADLTALRERHAEAVEAAFREGYVCCEHDREMPAIVNGSEDEAWATSDAKARLT